MKKIDLGELRGDIVIFGGVYSNLHALEALSIIQQIVVYHQRMSFVPVMWSHIVLMQKVVLN